MYRYLKCCLLAVGLGVLLPNHTRAEQKSLSVDDLAAWKRIKSRAISKDGKWVATLMAPWVGDGEATLYNEKGEAKATFPCADRFYFSASSRHLLVHEKPSKQLTDSLKLKKTKSDKMPMDVLIVHRMDGSTQRVDSMRTFKMAEGTDHIAYQRGRKSTTLYICALGDSAEVITRIADVTEYAFAKKSGKLYYICNGKTPGLYLYDIQAQRSMTLKEGKGVFRRTVISEDGNRVAFLYCEKKDSVQKQLDLWISERGTAARMLATRAHHALPKKWVISENGSLWFSQNAERLFLGTAPEPRQKDTLQLPEYRPNVQVWSWDEPEQYTVQNYRKGSESKRTYQAVYHLESDRMVQLATPDKPEIMIADKGDAPIAVLYNSKPYSLSQMWEGRTKRDYYAISLENGECRPLSTADYGSYRLSPKGKYAYWYAETDSSWYTISLADGKKHRLTTPQTFPAWNEEFDMPDYPNAYGSAGWTEGDQHLLIRDRYDIWQFDPNGQQQPIRLTTDGREKRITYHLLTLDAEARSVDLQKTQLLGGFNEKTKGYGFYSIDLSQPSSPTPLLTGDFMLRTIEKAKNAERVIFTRESYTEFPDVYYAALDFKNPIRLTNGGEQQKDIRWGTAELVTWQAEDGQLMEGLLHKPDGFDPTRKYPMIVYFYERYSNTLHDYRMPSPGSSSVNYHHYNSHEYIVFTPDIRYRDGHPGESCYNCVIPGVKKIIEQGYVDEKAIGAQGHSWGGYQAAYLATRTNMFAAIESGAPVVNMFSAYGGIRWGSGLARSFQYEHTQSRLGGTPWNAADRYFENSPLFQMDKVETPILILHNDADGHVPWYQGIEYFVAMKRLGKTCWMLNYPGEPHWPTTMPNRIDFQKRMFQFFDHYLKKTEMPKWMREGVRAVDQPYELGY